MSFITQLNLTTHFIYIKWYLFNLQNINKKFICIYKIFEIGFLWDITDFLQHSAPSVSNPYHNVINVDDLSHSTPSDAV